MGAPAARAGIVHETRSPATVTVKVPLSSTYVNPAGSVVFSQPRAAAPPVFRSVRFTVRTEPTSPRRLNGGRLMAGTGARRRTVADRVTGGSGLPFPSEADQRTWIGIGSPSERPVRTRRRAMIECGPVASPVQLMSNPFEELVKGVTGAREVSA